MAVPPLHANLAKRAAGEKLVSVLGADVARQCIEIGAVDQILVCITPVKNRPTGEDAHQAVLMKLGVRDRVHAMIVA